MDRWMHDGDVVRRKTLLRHVYQEIRLWPKTGVKPWTRKVEVVANLEALTRAFVVAPYLKALRRQVSGRLPNLERWLLAKWPSGPGQSRHVILTLAPDIADPFRRNHIFAVSAA
jgi:hypothetical protein